MSLSIFDVASFILEEEGEMSTMKLQKLCYFSQGWALAWSDRPLFPEDFQAWANGPVSRPLYSRHKGKYAVSRLDAGDPAALSDQQMRIVDSVLDKYAHLSGFQLSELTHKGAPWKSVRERFHLEDGDRCEVVISKESIKKYFSTL